MSALKRAAIADGVGVAGGDSEGSGVEWPLRGTPTATMSVWSDTWSRFMATSATFCASVSRRARRVRVGEATADDDDEDKGDTSTDGVPVADS